MANRLTVLESYITYNDLIKAEPQLAQYEYDEDPRLENLLNDSLDNLITIVENKLPAKGDLRKVCIRLFLTDATQSNEDKIGRRRLVIKMSDTTENTFKLEGVNSTTGTYTTVLDSSQIVTSAINNTFIFREVYKYYKLTQMTGTATFTAYLVETSFELPHKYLALSQAFKRLQALQGDVFQNRAEYYAEMFDDAISNLNYSFDVDEDESITTADTTYNTTIIGIKK